MTSHLLHSEAGCEHLIPLPHLGLQAHTTTHREHSSHTLPKLYTQGRHTRGRDILWLTGQQDTEGCGSASIEYLLDTLLQNTEASLK